MTSGSDSESEYSSSEGGKKDQKLSTFQVSSSVSGSRKESSRSQKRGIPVAPPKLPSFDSPSFSSSNNNNNNGLSSPSSSSRPPLSSKLLNVLPPDVTGNNCFSSLSSFLSRSFLELLSVLKLRRREMSFDSDSERSCCPPVPPPPTPSSFCSLESFTSSSVGSDDSEA